MGRSLTTGLFLFEKHDFQIIVLFECFKTDNNSVFVICSKITERVFLSRVDEDDVSCLTGSEITRMRAASYLIQMGDYAGIGFSFTFNRIKVSVCVLTQPYIAGQGFDIGNEELYHLILLSAWAVNSIQLLQQSVVKFCMHCSFGFYAALSSMNHV